MPRTYKNRFAQRNNPQRLGCNDLNQWCAFYQKRHRHPSIRHMFFTQQFVKMHTPYEKMHTPPIFCTPLYKSLSEGMEQGKISRRKCVFLVSMDLRDVAIFMGRCEKALFQAAFGHKTRTLMLIASVSKLAFLYVL